MPRRLLPLPSGEDRDEGSAIAHARALRRTLTPAESVLWHVLRRRLAAAKFRRQVPCGPYILDFACAPSRLTIEVDGDTHAAVAAGAHDARRTAWIAAHGIRVLRFPNRDVLGNLEGVLAVTSGALAHPHPGLGLPCGPRLEGEGGRTEWVEDWSHLAEVRCFVGCRRR